MQLLIKNCYLKRQLPNSCSSKLFIVFIQVVVKEENTTKQQTIFTRLEGLHVTGHWVCCSQWSVIMSMLNWLLDRELNVKTTCTNGVTYTLWRHIQGCQQSKISSYADETAKLCNLKMWWKCKPPGTKLWMNCHCIAD